MLVFFSMISLQMPLRTAHAPNTVSAPNHAHVNSMESNVHAAFGAPVLQVPVLVLDVELLVLYAPEAHGQCICLLLQ